MLPLTQPVWPIKMNLIAQLRSFWTYKYYLNVKPTISKDK